MALSIVMSLARRRARRSLALALAGVLAAGALACTWRRLPAGYRPFFSLHFKEQPAELRRMPIERQLDVYIVGVTAIHPPRSDLGLVIGEQGPVILPALFDRLPREQHGYIKSSLVWIMVGMPAPQTCDPRLLQPWIRCAFTSRPLMTLHIGLPRNGAWAASSATAGTKPHRRNPERVVGAVYRAEYEHC